MKEAYLLYPQPCNVLEDAEMEQPVYFKFEEDFVEDQRRRRAVDEEVVPLERRADQAGDDHSSRGAGTTAGSL